MLGLCACSEKPPPAGKLAVKHITGRNRYAVTFAAVKVPDGTLASLDLPAYGEPVTPDSCRKLADYVLAHAADFSIRTPIGNCLPIVWNNSETHVMVLPDPKQEERDFQTLGMMTKGFEASVKVGDEDEGGEVYCDWFCSCGIHLSEPAGDSTDHGITAPCGVSLISLGQPVMWPIFHANGVSLWILTGLNRN